MLASLLSYFSVEEITTTSYTVSSSGSTMSPLFWVVYFAVIIILIVALWKVFVKAGKPGWASIIPIYNTWVLFEIGGKPGWYALLFFIPIVNIVALVLLILAMVEICRRFGKSPWFVLLFFVASIGWLILGFDKSTYSAGAGSAVDSGAPKAPSAA